MKKIASLFLVVLLLGACSEETGNPNKESVDKNKIPEEVTSFIEEYNSNLDVLKEQDMVTFVPSEMDKKAISKFKKNGEHGFTKSLIEEKNEETRYEVNAWFDKEKKFIGYSLNTLTQNLDEPLISPEGISSAVIMIKSLGLDPNKLTDFISGNQDDITYNEEDYEVSLLKDFDMGLLNVRIKPVE